LAPIFSLHFVKIGMLQLKITLLLSIFLLFVVNSREGIFSLRLFHFANNLIPFPKKTKELGECICDLTRNACDANCCCDSDCSDATKVLTWHIIQHNPTQPNPTQSIKHSINQPDEMNE
jgi:Protein of unknown function (DUF1619).